MTSLAQVVFDCNTLLQALASPDGPAGACVQLVFNRDIELFISAAVLAEFVEVTSRPRVIQKLRLESNRVDQFIFTLQHIATIVDPIPESFTYSRDPDDACYVNLAIESGSLLIVSRDHDLLDLMSDHNADGMALRRQYPEFCVVTPPEYLRRYRVNPVA